MRKLILYFLAVILLISLSTSCHSRKNKSPVKQLNVAPGLPFDSNLIASFYRSFPELKKYRKDLVDVYREHNYTYIWYDKQGIVEYGNTLFSRERELNTEGVSSRFPYQEKINAVFANGEGNKLSQSETELMLTNLYLFYTGKVYKGLGDSTTRALGWLLPRKQVSYARLIDSVMSGPVGLKGNDSVLFSQYYKLRNVLKRYREIEKKGGWIAIDTDHLLKSYKPGITDRVILQIRQRLFITGELKNDNKSDRYDPDLVSAVKKFKLHNGNNPQATILPGLIREMNIPVGERIKQIIVNMERCRWIDPGFDKASVYILVNIPSFSLNMVRDGKSELESSVIVGDSLTKTIVFSGMLNQIVFSPYWIVPQSILEDEIKPGIAKNKNYLRLHNMEWHKGQVRQKPGKNNSLGRVKFIFPNSDDIYMHDTPARSLFAKETRAFSHGCIRVGKPRTLAVDILKGDPDWTPKKIDAAMHAGKEKAVRLKIKIPVYIGYLTAWVDTQGEINFYKDIYNKDERLRQLLISDK